VRRRRPPPVRVIKERVGLYGGAENRKHSPLQRVFRVSFNKFQLSKRFYPRRYTTTSDLDSENKCESNEQECESLATRPLISYHKALVMPQHSHETEFSVPSTGRSRDVILVPPSPSGRISKPKRERATDRPRSSRGNSVQVSNSPRVFLRHSTMSQKARHRRGSSRHDSHAGCRELALRDCPFEKMTVPDVPNTRGEEKKDSSSRTCVLNSFR